MSPTSPSFTAGWRLQCLVALVCLAAAFAMRPLDRVAEDGLLRLATFLGPGPELASADASVVAIDARSLRAFEGWPWSRSVLAAAIQELHVAGASAVVVDVDLSTARDEAGDAALEQAIRTHGRVGLATLRQFEVIEGLGEMEISNRPLPRFIDAGAALGHVLVPVDADGVVRRAHGTTEIGAEPVPSLADLAMTLALETEGETAPHRIDFRASAPSVPVLSIADVIERRYEPGDLEGRTIFIGATALELQDLWPTPVRAAMPGVELQAIDYRTRQMQLAGVSILRAPAGLSAALTALVLLLGVGINARATRARASLFGGVAVCVAGGSLVGVTGFGVLFSPLLPLVACAGEAMVGMEAVRQRLGLDIAARERSLATVLEVGRTTARSSDSEDPLEASLTLLADVVGARGALLLRTTPSGRWDDRRLDWSPNGHRVEVEPEIATQSLQGREIRLIRGADGTMVHAPLWVGETPIGLLAFDCPGTDLDGVQMRTVATVASQMALSARNMRLVEDLQDTLASSVEAMASAIEARDGYTEMHCRRLALFSVSMGRRLDLPEDEIEGIRLGALLHDVGKIGIRDEILLKPGRFSGNERRVMQSHVEIGHRIVSPIHGLPECTVQCVRSHHERWDGSGYPDRLAGFEIPRPARIISIVDVWDALSSARPYKPAFTQPDVLEILHKSEGTHFDPDLLQLFFRVLEEEGDEMLSLVADSTKPSREATG
jgi:CHASE2 domain-containing sensor protein